MTGVVITAVFALAGLSCLAGIQRASLLRTADARTGLRWLLALVGVWALLLAGQSFASTESVALAFYTGGLLIGLATPFAWLYFTSAYTGRQLHRDRTLQVLGVSVYLTFVVTKLTNPIHGGYYTAEFVMSPYPRLLVDHSAVYWVSFSVAYAMTAVGLYLLYTAFRQSPQSAAELGGLCAVTVLSAVPRGASTIWPGLFPELSYEPVGVAVFALGALYVADIQFVSLEIPGRQEFYDETAQGAVLLDQDGRIWSWNDRATQLLPGIGETIQTATDITPELSLNGTRRAVTFSHPLGDRRYLMDDQPIEDAPGRMLIIQDITHETEQQTEINRNDQQLGSMSGAIRHELRNALTVLRFSIDRADRAVETDRDATRDAIDVAAETTDRLEEVTEQLNDLTRYISSVGELERVTIAEVAARGRPRDSPVRLQTQATAELQADPARLEELFDNAFAFAAYNNADVLTVEAVSDGFVITDDGRHTAAGHGDQLFVYEAAAPTADAGMTLPNVRTIAEAHGWTVTADTAHTGGVRYAIHDVPIDEPSEEPE